MNTRLAPMVLLVASLGVAACGPGKPCSDSAVCPPGAQCWCDGAGRLVQEERDANGDERLDRIRTVRGEDGRILRIETDWGRDGHLERHQEFGYDSAGRRVTSSGWLEKCAGEKFHWSCTYAEPCPPPHQRCAVCPNRYEVESADGKRKPLGQHGELPPP